MLEVWRYIVSRIQIRYGSRWGPRHPSANLDTTPVEIFLKPGESITHLNANFGSALNGVQVNTTYMLYSWIGGTAAGMTSGRHGHKVIYFKGFTLVFYQYGTVVSQLNVVFDSCDF